MNIKQDKFELSIITISYNAEAEIEKTLKSIQSQDIDKKTRIQYLIQDGKSKDRTLSIVKRYTESLEQKGISVSVFTEEDQGIYDAMNKGILKANGKWICLLNAGDVFTDSSALAKVVAYLEKSQSDIVYADYNRINSYLIRTVHIQNIDKLCETMIFCHQAIFIRDYVYSKELYDCQYKLVADYDLMLRLFLKQYKFEHFSEVLIDYDTEGISGKNMEATYKEIYLVRKMHGVLKSPYKEKCKYYIGIFKRRILASMPQKLRWMIYRMIKNSNIYGE